MSPVNSDDSSGDVFGGAGRPLTRKELRAQQKVQGTEGQDVIPPQAFETGEDVPPAAPRAGHGTVPEAADAVQPAPIQAADAPDRPAAAPTVHEEAVDEPVDEVPVQHEPVHHEPVHEEPEHFEPVHAEATHREPVHEEPVHEYAGGVAREDAVHYQADVPPGHETHELHHDAEVHDGHAVHPDDARYVSHDARYVSDGVEGRPAEYHEEDGRVVLAGGAAIRTSKGPSKKVRRRRRFLALLLTLTVFVVAIVVGAQFLSRSSAGTRRQTTRAPAPVKLLSPCRRAPARGPWRPSSRTRKWWRTPTPSCGNSWLPAGRWPPEISPCARK